MKSFWPIVVFTAIGIIGVGLGNPMRAGRVFMEEAHCLSIEKERDLGERVFREIQRQMASFAISPQSGKSLVCKTCVCYVKGLSLYPPFQKAISKNCTHSGKWHEDGINGQAVPDERPGHQMQKSIRTAHQ